ncbi:AAA family ATPase [Rhizobium rhizogenes]|uniref:AAA family ATPase n=1 Tax=Rhizobium rhizogenes TaxID=359 RepID=UPI0022BE5EDC|nr:AAA family ATPase [Rhizobium rhizogenes]MCZ7481025.1 AAA family ATPase [Rhizobium rhizogenes]
MKLLKVKIEGLLGRSGDISADFNDDLNIITGRNGAGKTTFLKLIWYILSGNIHQACTEIEFDRIYVSTSMYKCTVVRVNSSTCRAEYIGPDGRSILIEDEYGDEEILRDARDVLGELLSPVGSSLFFPTFRRIEGGFSMGGTKLRAGYGFIPTSGPSKQLEDAMSGLSRKMSNDRHAFVTSISTIDIESMLLKNYAELSEESNRLQQTVSNDIIDVIRSYKVHPPGVAEGEAEAIENANQVIDSIHKQIEEMESKRNNIMAPMEAIQRLIAQFFKHSGIRFGTRLSFGDAASAINSDSLSAGEKQMLSFLCYNAFNRNTVAFIDEPELSLHADWQRLIFPTLLKQKSGNQFIIATHSPFIYSKYPDKEISIDGSHDRGDNLAED